ncbi:MAG: hypothetical protein PHG82_01850 [Candidatus Gracilibacteria bacterium]|nr:hypothetical protein [Candidatus Gracilibacteria bacterium]
MTYEKFFADFPSKACDNKLPLDERININSPICPYSGEKAFNFVKKILERLEDILFSDNLEDFERNLHLSKNAQRCYSCNYFREKALEQLNQSE